MIHLPNDGCREYFQAVVNKAKALRILPLLIRRLEWLGKYAVHPDSTDERERSHQTRCCLYGDFASLSFTFAMEHRYSDSEPWKFWFNGGLIYQGPGQPLDGSFPALTVSLSPPKQGWSVHT